MIIPSDRHYGSARHCRFHHRRCTNNKVDVELVARISAAIRSKNLQCPKFTQFNKRLEQLHDLAQELSQREGPQSIRNKYTLVRQWLAECKTFLQRLYRGGDIRSYLLDSFNGGSASQLDWHHKIIEYCHEILQQRSLNRLEDKMRVLYYPYRV